MIAVQNETDLVQMFGYANENWNSVFEEMIVPDLIYFDGDDDFAVVDC